MSEEETSLTDFGDESQLKTVDLDPIRIQIPKYWDFRSVDSLSNLVTDGAHQTPDYVDDGIRFLSTKNLKPGGSDFDYSEYEKFITEKEYSSLCDRVSPQRGDILISKSGTIGIAQLVRKDFDFNIFVGLALLRPTDEANSVYLEQLFNWTQIRGAMRARSPGSTRSTLPIFALEQLELPLPPLSEQRKIATVLHTVDQAIQKTDEVIEQTENIGRGLRQSLFTEGYYEHDTESYGTLGEVPASWKKTRLYKIADVARGKFTHRPRNDPDFYNGEYPFIQTGEVVDAVGELTDFSQTLNEKGKEVSKKFTSGTIIMTIAGNIGDTAVATFPVYFPDSLVGITTDEETDERFLEHFLRYRKAFLNRLSTKTTQKNLNLTLLRPIEVVKPPLDEQKKIADTLTTVDNQIKKEIEYKNHLQRLKRGLMQDLLSGTVRTTDTNIEVPDEIAQYG